MWFKKKEDMSPEKELYKMISVVQQDKVQKQGYMDFPLRSCLYYRKKDINDYRKEPIISKLIARFQPFFENGIDYTNNDKNYNYRLRYSYLFYINEAFSLCTKLSIDTTPEDYFIQEYWDDMDIPDIDRFFVLNLVYVLLGCNCAIRKQHLKMIDLIDGFLRRRCPPILRATGYILIDEIFKSSEYPYWKFLPEIDRFGNKILNINEGLTDDDEEQVELVNQTRQMVKEHIKTYLSHCNDIEQCNIEKEMPVSNTDKNTKVRLKTLLEILKVSEMGTNEKDMTKVARIAAYILGSSYEYIYKLMSKGYELDDKTHGNEVDVVNQYLKELDSEIRLKVKKS